MVAVTGDRRRGFSFAVQSNVIASQVALHARYGGVVPEVAARAHVEAVIPTIAEAIAGSLPPDLREQVGTDLLRAGPTLAQYVDAIAVTAGPGLVSALAVGAETARTLAYAWQKPLIAVSHIEGHVLSSLLPSARENGELIMENGELSFPVLALIVSGGHTELLLMRGWGKYECIGATRDDAAGEAFDKVAKLLELPYPGGPAVAKAAAQGNPTAFDFPRGMRYSKDFDFSFSGLKTSVRYFLERLSPSERTAQLNDICASFQAAVVDVLVTKTMRAVDRYHAKTVILGGGVAANHALREELGRALRDRAPACDYRLPDLAYTGDNAAMIAAAGGVQLLLGKRTPWQRLRVDPNWELGR
jgi:N6-L-threonylcarbamoyladenine synthase